LLLLVGDLGVQQTAEIRVVAEQGVRSPLQKAALGAYRRGGGCLSGSFGGE
jgi:hypothetical protein